MFASWKEMGIIILLWKTRKHYSLASRYVWIFVTFAIVVAIYTIIGYDSHFSITGGLKKYLFPFMFMLAVSKIKFDDKNLFHFLTILFVGAFIVDFFGILDFLSPTLRMIFRDVMRFGYQIASDGTIYYETCSFQIMGFDRTCGIMAGGPNQFGVYNSGIFMLCIFSYMFFYKNAPKYFKTILNIITVISSWMLLVSFSRAGWAMVAITLFAYTFLDKTKRVKMIAIVFVVFIAVLIAMAVSPTVNEILVGTFTGQEASSASRADMTNDSWNLMIRHPLGYGLGASDAASVKRVAFAESFMINLGFEMGIVGILLLSVLILRLSFTCYKYRYTYLLAKVGFCFFIAYYITSWVSVNPFENPFVYYAWMIPGLALNKSFCSK